MSLQTKITKGRLVLPKRLLVHGGSGVGKSTFAAGAPDVLFIDPERRTGHLDVARVEPDAWLDVLSTIADIVKDGSYKTVVFSTIDFIEGMAAQYVCKREGASGIEAVGGGWGKGYTMVAEEFRRLSNALEAMRRAGITTVLEVHSAVRPFLNPLGENYEVWAIKLDKRIKSLLVERCDAVGFATFEDFASKKKGEWKAKVVTTGDRVLKFGHHPAYETKAGFNLPDQIPLEWSAWANAVEASYEV